VGGIPIPLADLFLSAPHLNHLCDSSFLVDGFSSPIDQNFVLPVMFSQALLLACALPFATAVETVLGVYIFHRHGDRTAKSTPPANLTDLGFQEVYTAGQYFRDRYISSSATSRITGIESDVVKLSQLSVSAPVDNVLQTSAMGFLSALYPPVGPKLGSNTLRNGTTVQAPLNGFQLIPVNVVSAGAGSEDNGWLQGATNCAGATTSSNQYFYTQDYERLLDSTMDFYKSLTPMINGTFSDSQISFKNAFTSTYRLYPSALYR